MAILIDKLRRTELKWGHNRWCHMISDLTDNEEAHKELLKMAFRLRMKPEWIHNGDHFDLTASKRILALQHGAKEVTARELSVIAYIRRSSKAHKVSFIEAERILKEKHEWISRIREGSSSTS